MIIECINCNKKFNVNSNLIPDSGREIQCGSCNHVWFYNKEKQITAPLTLNESIVKDEIKTPTLSNDNEKNIEKDQNLTEKVLDKKTEKKFDKEVKNEKSKKTEKKTGSKFFSYLIVFIISFIALIILLDTLKTPLINIFPGLEIILFNLFETLKDIKLFIIDLS